MKLFKIAEGTGPYLSDMPVKVERYGERTWAVYFGGALLCVTVYLRGARAVQALIESMQEELRQAVSPAMMPYDEGDEGDENDEDDEGGTSFG